MESSETTIETAGNLASKQSPQHPRRSLFQFDPGWPFVVTGIGLIVAGVLIPAQRDLHELRGSLEVHRALLEHSERRLAAYEGFVEAIDEGETQLVRRLAASQLNRMAVDERPYLMLPSMNETVSSWIDASEPLEVPVVSPYPDTLLSRLATGPRRLWVLASGVFLIFLGLVFGPTTEGDRVRSRPERKFDLARTARGAIAGAHPSDASPEVIRSNAVLPIALIDSIDFDASSAEHLASGVAVTEAVEADFVFENVVVEDVVVEDVVVEDVVVEDVVVEDVVVEDVVVEDVVVEDVVVEDIVVEQEVTEDDVTEDDVDEDEATSVAARTESCVGEQEVEISAARPDAYDRALDTLSLFHGLDDAQWIDTRDPRAF
jgi:hypothetical protein